MIDPNTAYFWSWWSRVQSEVTVDLGFGEKYQDYSQSSMQGYAQPLTKVQKRQDEEDNEKIDVKSYSKRPTDHKRSDLGDAKRLNPNLGCQ